MQRWRFAVACLAVFVCAGLAAAAPLPAWEFEVGGDLEGWAGNARVLGLRGEGGCLVGESLDGDPIIVGPQIEFDSGVLQYVEIRMRADRDGLAEIFWAPTTEEPYGGFRPGKEKAFNVVGDGRFHVYRLFPLWRADARIFRLRLDPPDSCHFAVDYLRVGEQVALGVMREPRWNFAEAGAAPWHPLGGIDEVTLQGGAMRLRVNGGDPLLAAPVEPFDAAGYPFASLRIESARARRIYLRWDSGGLPALSQVSLNLEPGLHVYIVPLEAQPGWQGEEVFLGLALAPGRYQDLAVHSVLLGSQPEGPGEVKVQRLTTEERICRAQRPFRIRAMMANVGAATAQLVAHLRTLPAVARRDSPRQGPLSLAPGEERTLEWEVYADRGEELRVTVTARGDTGQVRKETALTVTDPVNYQWQPDEDPRYAPEPRPARGDYEVGVYYFPGWKGYGRWQCLERFPERHPVLGYYPEGRPEVADWHIKWAVEHGITFFIYDWYWSQGARQLEHGLHDGYFKSRYHDYLKFCLLWANHNPPNTSSLEDCLAVTDYWIANYFLRPDYLTAQGKPVVFIFSPGRLTEDMGSPAVAAAFEEMRAKCREVGLPGLFLVGCTNDDPNNLRRLKEEGYDAASAYNYPAAGMTGGRVAPYSAMVDGMAAIWENVRRVGAIDYIVPTSPGWDSRPWHGDDALVRTGNTPQEFARMLHLAKDYVDSQALPPFGKMIVVEAWNEFGEGSYIEPHRQFGFGYLDAIREVFVPEAAAHQDLVPEDVSLGPYGTPKPTLAARWEFERAGDREGWNSYGEMEGVEVRDGALHLYTTGGDPMIFGPPTQVDARKFKRLSIRMSTTGGDVLQIFWQSEYQAISEQTSVRFKLIPDGEMHVYEADLTAARTWRGTITQLRLDPTSAPKAAVRVDWLRVE